MEEDSSVKEAVTNQTETNHVNNPINKTNDIEIGGPVTDEPSKSEQTSSPIEGNTDSVLNGGSPEADQSETDKCNEPTNDVDTTAENANEDEMQNQENGDAIETDQKNQDDFDAMNTEMDVDKEDKDANDDNEANMDTVENTEENNAEETTGQQEEKAMNEEVDNPSVSNSNAIPDNDNNIVDANDDEDDNLDLNEPCSNTENEPVSNSNPPETSEQSNDKVPIEEDNKDEVNQTEKAEDVHDQEKIEEDENIGKDSVIDVNHDKSVNDSVNNEDMEEDDVNNSVNDESVNNDNDESVNNDNDESVNNEEEISHKPEEMVDTSVREDSNQGFQEIEGDTITNDITESVEYEPDNDVDDTSNKMSDFELRDNNISVEMGEKHEDSITDKTTDEVMESRDSFEVIENEQSLLDDSNSADCLISSEDKETAAESVDPSMSENGESGEKMEVTESMDESQNDVNQGKENEGNELDKDKNEQDEPSEKLEDISPTADGLRRDTSPSQTKDISGGLVEDTNSVNDETSKLTKDNDISEESQGVPDAEVSKSEPESPSKEDESNISTDKTVPEDSNGTKGISSESVGKSNDGESDMKEMKSVQDAIEKDDVKDSKEVNEDEDIMEIDDVGESVKEDSKAVETGTKDVKEKDIKDVVSKQAIDDTDTAMITLESEKNTKCGDVSKAEDTQVEEEAMEVSETSPSVQVEDKTTDSNQTTTSKTSDAASSKILEAGEVKKEMEEKTDSTSELKIGHVISTQNNQVKATPNDEGLGLKIDSVSGAGDAKPQVEVKSKEENKPVTIKKEKIEEETVEKKELVKSAETDTKKQQDDDDDDVIAIKEEKKPPPPKPKSSKIQKCIVCAKVGKCKYNIVRNGDVKHLCDDKCFKQFRSDPTSFLKQAEKEKEQLKDVKTKAAAKEPLKPASTNLKNVMASAKQKTVGGDSYKTCTVCQLMNVKTSKPFLNWQGLDYCGEECLGKFQGNLSVTCTYCSTPIHQTNKAKFCARIGSDVKHFCSQTCNNEFVKRIKVCAFCNKDLAKENDSFMAPVGNQGMFKDFCTQACLLKYEDKHSKDVEVTGELINGTKTAVAPTGNFTCAVCSKSGPIKHELKLENKLHRLCSDPCFSAFQYANKLTLNCCDSCGTPCNQSNDEAHFVQFEGKQKRFCSFICVNQFRNQKRKLTPCAWCGNKKSNFDMIERVDSNNKFQLFCSLNCLSLYRVNLQATSNQAVLCDQCQKFVPAQYHLTMSDASVRNFCSYGCVMQFQAQFQSPQTPKQPAQNNTQKQVQTTPPVTTTRSGRVVKGGAKQQQYMDTQLQKKETTKQNKANQDSVPIISNVVSLAPKGNQQQINIRSAGNVTVTDQQSGKTITTSTGNQTVQQQIIIQPPPPKSVKNKSLLCKPFVQTKATACRPHTQTKEVQTEGKPEPDKIFVPVPVPIYCPTPLSMYTMPAPILVPVPVPIPVPVFIPTTKKNSASILKQIKEIQEKIPADPLEAELLMMAEAVAGKGEDSSSDSEDGEPEAPVSKEVTPATTGGVLGEDMLQMALRMASEMSDEPVMDLETSLEPVAVNTAPPAPPPPPPQVKDEDTDDDEEYIPTTRARRGRGSAKRQTRSTPRRNTKKQKTAIIPQPVYHTPTPSPPPPQAPPPDSNFHLKYTYGVNAFKYWVTQKNSQLEEAGKSGHSRSLKTFKTDILQCTADELNYALCLFVKEVRKPNTEEYAVDSIYYLCLGIQQYLFENGRIDNVFTDMYYERFTECLNELLCKYEPKLNAAGQLVCRIEEEHLWESKQLGAHSPHVLLNTLVYFNTKYFMLKTSEDHLKLSFTHIMKHWKKTASGRGSGVGVNAGRSVYLRYYCPTPQNKDNNSKKKKEEMPVYEQTENLDNPLRCPVKLYEFYLSKCPESIKNRNDTFYLIPERSCVPDSPVWYSTAMLGVDAMAKMLNRIRLVREIQEAHLHTQPIYI